MAEQTKYAVFGVGNALLDVSCDVSPELLDQYELKNGNAILAEPKHGKLFETLHANPNVKYISGGATLNTIRVANWMLKSVNGRACSYVSILGKDEQAKTFQNGCKGEGLDTAFAAHDTLPTGQCAVCIQDKERSLVAALNCCNEFPTGDDDFLLNDVSATSLWKNSDIVYIAGFWLTVNTEGMQKLAKTVNDSNRTFALNISAPFLAQFFTENMKSVLKHTDILFGNETEAAALAGALNIEKDEQGKYDNEVLAKEFLKLSDRSTKRVVITQGKDPVIIAKSVNGEVTMKSYDVPLLEAGKIVDLNGAGDSFVGGFLAAHSLGQSEEQCVAWGNYGARFIIQRSGIQFEGQSASPPSN